MKLYRPTLQTASTAALLFFLPHAVHAQDVCEAFAKYGIYDTQTATSDTDKAASFRSWFCQSKFESKEAADSAGMSLGYGGFTLGFDSNSESWSQFYSNYCRDDSYSTMYHQSTLSFVQTINANASSNMLACFLRGGLHARVVPGARQDTFYVQARMNPTGSTTKASVVGFSVVGGTCSGPMKNGYEITAAGVEQLCQRSGEQAVDISLSASEQVNWDTPRGLKKIVPPPPPLPKLECDFSPLEQQTWSAAPYGGLSGTVNLVKVCSGLAKNSTVTAHFKGKLHTSPTNKPSFGFHLCLKDGLGTPSDGICSGPGSTSFGQHVNSAEVNLTTLPMKTVTGTIQVYVLGTDCGCQIISDPGATLSVTAIQE